MADKSIRVPIDEVIKRNEEEHGHFFDAGSRRFFNSRWDQYAYKFDNYYYFITSEKFDSVTARKYTIRFCCCECMTISDIGGFQNFPDHAMALSQLHKIMSDDDKTHRAGYHHWKMELKHVPCHTEECEKVDQCK